MSNMPAFPRPYSGRSDYSLEFQEQTGMDLRDYFAAAALTGIISNSDGFTFKSEIAASYAYEYADAMLKAREARG